MHVHRVKHGGRKQRQEKEFLVSAISSGAARNSTTYVRTTWSTRFRLGQSPYRTGRRLLTSMIHFGGIADVTKLAVKGIFERRKSLLVRSDSGVATAVAGEGFCGHSRIERTAVST